MFNLTKAANTANKYLGQLLASTQEQRPAGTERVGGHILSNHTAIVDLTKADDEVSVINPPSIENAFPPRLPRRHYTPPLGPRPEIHDPYLDLPVALKPSSTGPMSSSRRPNIDRIEEDRLLGSSRQPKDAQPIAIPGTVVDNSRPVHAPKSKPGAGSAYQPINTLDKVKKVITYKGTAGNRQAQSSSRHPRGTLSTASSRGQNVLATQPEFPIEQHAKKQKVSHTQANGHISQPVQQHHTVIDSDSDSEVKVAKNTATVVKNAKKEVTHPSYVKPHRLSSWEPSGNQEARHIDAISRPPRSTRVQQNGASTSQTTIPFKKHEVVEVSDDGAVKAPVSVKKRSRPLSKSPEEYGSRMDGQSRKEVQTAKSAVLSPYFVLEKTGVKKKSTATEPIDVDAAEPQLSSLASSVRAALGPGKTSRGREPKQSSKLGESRPADRRSTNGDDTQNSYNTDDHFTSDDQDELSRDIPSSFVGGKTITRTSRGPVSNAKTSDKPSWRVAELVDPFGKRWEEFEFLVLDIDIGIENRYVRLRKPDAADRLDNLCTINCRSIRDALFSTDADCEILRIRGGAIGGRESLHDIKFHDHPTMIDFVEALHHATKTKNVEGKSTAYMNRIYGKRYDYHRNADAAVDDGVEEALLNSRVDQASTQVQGRARKPVEGNRRARRATLLSEMKTNDRSSQDVKKSTSARPAQKRIKPQKEDEIEDEPPASSNRPVRSTRGRKARSVTPLDSPSFKRYSKDPGLGPPWDQPVIYPETGRKRVTVDFTDLERLDEGEFLNDNLIEFYSRWLQVNRPIKERTAYFFGTHFYTTVSETPKSEKGSKTPRSSVNYKAVERWTAKEDIFDYDFVIVPVNESAHWYLAIICNLPNVRRKLANDGEDEVEEVEEVSLPNSTTAAKGSKSQPVDMSELSDGILATTQSGAQPQSNPSLAETDGENKSTRVQTDVDMRATETTPTRGMSQQCHDMRLTSPKPEVTVGSPTAPEIIQPDEQEVVAVDVETADTKPEAADTKVYDVPDSQTEQERASQTTAGVFTDAAPPSPEKKRKGKRKSVPRGYGPGQPAIIIMDPMGINHPRAITVLKDYLIEEALSKRGMEIDRTVFQGVNAKEGIPKQGNYYDCGVFILGYMDKFMSSPQEFGEKLLARSFDEAVDWPEMKSNNMRNTMRELLQQIAKEQRDSRQAKKQEKRAVKRQVAAAASSPPGQSTVNPIDLSSPTQLRTEGKQASRGVEDRYSELARKSRSPSKVPRATEVPPKVAAPLEDDEMIMQPHHDVMDRDQATAGDVEMSQDRERTYISDSDSGDEREVVKPGQNFDIWEEQSQAGTGTRPPTRSLPGRTNVDYKIDLEL